MEFSIYFGSGRGKENDKARHVVFFTPLNPFCDDPDEETLHDDHTVPQKVHHQTCGNAVKMQYIG